MKYVRAIGLSLAVVSASALTGCGGDDPSPAQPAPVVVATPTPQPTPTPKALSVIPPCSLPAGALTGSTSCTKPTAKLGNQVNAAIDRTLSIRPDLFNFQDVNGGPRILDYKSYMTAVVAALGEAGLCGNVDAEGEIGVKTGNGFSEQWIIASRAGWNPPSGNWVIRKYVGACSPATF